MKALLLRVWQFFFPPSKWHRCKQLTAWERAAEWEIRRGKYNAEQRLRKARVDQVFDMRASVKPKVVPKLPDAHKVVQFRKRRKA